MIAAATCPACGHDTADPEHIIIDGTLRALSLTCRACGTMIQSEYPDEA